MPSSSSHSPTPPIAKNGRALGLVIFCKASGRCHGRSHYLVIAHLQSHRRQLLMILKASIFGIVGKEEDRSICLYPVYKFDGRVDRLLIDVEYPIHIDEEALIAIDRWIISQVRCSPRYPVPIDSASKPDHKTQFRAPLPPPA